MSELKKWFLAVGITLLILGTLMASALLIDKEPIDFFTGLVIIGCFIWVRKSIVEQ